MKKNFILTGTICLLGFMAAAQETLQTVTDRGNTTNISLQIGGYSVNANTTKLFINNPSGKNWALSSGANMISENGFHIYNWTDQFNASPYLSIANTGNVGISSHSPTFKLEVNGNFKTVSSGGYMIIDNIHSGENYYSANSFHAFQISGVEQMRLDQQGNVGIGTTTPQEKLSVNGRIRAKEIKVETANWPDYVFSKEYKLPDLKETEAFIKNNGHLPGVPSATVAEKEGIELGEMNKILLKKIEELTLHIIELNKKIEKKQLDNK